MYAFIVLSWPRRVVYPAALAHHAVSFYWDFPDRMTLALSGIIVPASTQQPKVAAPLGIVPYHYANIVQL